MKLLFLLYDVVYCVGEIFLDVVGVVGGCDVVLLYVLEDCVVEIGYD